MFEGGSESEGSSSSPLDVHLLQILRLLSTPRFDKQQVRLLLDRVADVGLRRGFTDREATRIVQIAVRCGSKQVGVKLLKCIYPAKDVQFGEGLVLSIIGSLGPTGDTVTDGSKEERTDSSDADEDESVSGSSSDKRKRRKVAISIQVAALRLLVLLYKPPPMISISLDLTQNDLSHAKLPIHFLSTKARKALHDSYSILFHYLDYQSHRPSLCHLLCLITRRRHVRHYRIEKLLFLRKIDPDDTNVEALISTHSRFLPSLQYVGLADTQSQPDDHAGGMRYPDAKWLLHVNEIWAHPEINQDGGDGSSREGSGDQHPRKRQKRMQQRQSLDENASLISLARTLLPRPVALSLSESSLMITEVISYKGLGYSFDHLQMPSQLASALAHKKTAVALYSQGQSDRMKGYMSRIMFWAMSALSEEMRLPTSKMVAAHDTTVRSNFSHQKSQALLTAVSHFVERMGSCTAALQRWISSLLQPAIWSSLFSDEQDAVLAIISNFAPSAFHRIAEQVLDPIRLLIKCATPQQAAKFVTALSRLLGRWTVGRDWAEVITALRDANSTVYFGCQALDDEVDYVDCISETVRSTVEESSRLLVQFPQSLLVMDATLSLYELIFTHQFVGLNPFRFPPRFSLNFFSLSQVGALVTFSRLLGIVRQIRDLHVEPKSHTLSPSGRNSKGVSEMPERMKSYRTDFYTEDSREELNRYTIYLTELFWRNSGLNSVKNGDHDFGLPHAFFTQLNERCTERGDDLDQIGSMSHGALTGTSLEVHANEISERFGVAMQGPITSHSLEKAKKSGIPAIKYKRFRDDHLNWLGDRGAKGVRDFCLVTIQRLSRMHEESDRTRGRSSSSFATG
ncbi:hypothetical protein CBS101457_006723 [Exobasidium rhododendri]|nr:hypothetical protein CBS101457_006723 [Exobasidium rhododendri]